MAHTVLIVDDDQYLRDLYQEVLTSEGYKVDTAIDGKEGYDKLQSCLYDLVLLDVMMPKMDGLQVLTKLAELPPVPTRKIVLLTNLAQDPVIQEAMKKGATTYLIKADLTPDQLTARIKEILA